MTQEDSEFKLHSPTEGNVFNVYQCGLRAGQKVALREPLVIHTQDGKPTGVVHPAGEIWTVLTGIRSDPVLWFRRPDGKRHTWTDDAAQVREWFEIVEDCED